MQSKKQPQLKEHVYFVSGMHCPSCEILIERRLLAEKGVEAVEASLNKNEARIEYKGKRLTIRVLNRIFKKNGYIFSDKPVKKTAEKQAFYFDKKGQLIVNKAKLYSFLTVFGAAFLIIIGFVFLSRSGLAALLSVNSRSALPAFFIFGLLAGFSSCSALTGGIILSMSKKWLKPYKGEASAWQKLKPHFLFNTGRLVSYTLLGGLLGSIGIAFRVSPTLTSFLTIAVSFVMIFLGFQMLGMKALQKFQPAMPRFATRFVAEEKNFKGRFMPFLMGFFTFFLPCGFTITAQSLALTSGSILQASLIMLFFALGTAPALLLIGFSSVKFSQKAHFAGQFLKIAGVLVLFFAFYNINSQLNVLGLKSLSDLGFSFDGGTVLSDGLPQIVGGKQILKIDALAFGYEPSRLRVRAGIPVRWEIADKGTSGCTNAIISRGLFDGQIDLVPGKVSVKEFTPQEPGSYKFSCWMGMVSGVIEVVDKDGSLAETKQTIPSGAVGCGGGCGGSCGNPGCPYVN